MSATDPGEATDVPLVALGAEDRKLVVLARAAAQRAHTPPPAGAPRARAVRDTDGRTYAAGAFEVDRPGWEHGGADVSAVRAAVVAAASSGVQALEAVCLVAPDPGLGDADRAAVAEMGGAALLLALPDGTVVAAQDTWTP